MQQKVWFINDIDLSETPSEKRKENGGEQRPRSASAQRNPAMSFSLSMLLWGSGHMYIRRFGQGTLLMGGMLIFYGAISSAVLFRDIVFRLLSENRASVPVVMFGTVMFIFSGIVCWLYGAVHAYFKTASLRSEPFNGVANEIWPALCSLIFPGWGQFLNGQPKKGIFFLIFAVLGIYSVSFTLLAYYIWPVLHAGSDWYFLEIYLPAALILFPVCFLMWMVSVHDSFWSCREPIRKRSFPMRLQFAREKIRTQGVRRSIMPKFKRLVALGLLLTLSVLAGLQVFPKTYYLDNLEQIQVEMLNKQMELIPDLVGEAVVFLRQRA